MKCLSFFTGLFGLGCVASVQAQVQKSPDVVLILVDQMIADGMSCVGNPYANTPNLDRIASQGVLFNRSYVTQPLSAPSRSSLQTGRFPHEVGIVKNSGKIRRDTPFLAQCVQEAGYRTAYFGKWHVMGISIGETGYQDGNIKEVDRETTKSAVRYINERDEQPYFMAVSYMNPHDVCLLARREALKQGQIEKAPENLNELPPLPHNFAIPEKEPQQIRVVQRSSWKHYPTLDWTEKDWRQYLWGYYRLIEMVDEEIGHVLDAIQKNGRETMVMFVSDHGEGVAMEHWNQKQILYEQVVNVPTILARFGKDAKKVGTSEELVSMSLDVPVTILDIVGAKKPKEMRGESLYPLYKSPKKHLKRKYAFAETRFALGATELGLHGRMVVSDRYKYCVYDRGEIKEQLFDLKNDPGEKKNLVFDASAAKVLKEMRKQLVRWAKTTADTDFNYPSQVYVK